MHIRTTYPELRGRLSDEPQVPGMHATTVRMSSRLWRMVRQAADEEGVSISQWTREAVLTRLTYMRATAHPEEGVMLEEVLREIRDETL